MSLGNSVIPVGPLTADQKRANELVQFQIDAWHASTKAFNQTTHFIWSDPTQAQAKFDAFQSQSYKGSDLVSNSESYIALAASLGVTVPNPVPVGYSLTVDSGSGAVTVVPPVAPTLHVVTPVAHVVPPTMAPKK